MRSVWLCEKAGRQVRRVGDSYTKHNGFHPSGMNSFNHFAFGSCVECFYSDVLGIKLVEEFGGIRIEPFIDWSGKLTWAKGSFKSRYGNIKSEWRVHGDMATVTVKIPVNVLCEFNFFGCSVMKKSRTENGIEFI